MGLNQSLLQSSEKRDVFIRYNVDGLLRGDQKSRYESYAIGIQNGFMSPNNVRTLEDWNLIPDELGGKRRTLTGHSDCFAVNERRLVSIRSARIHLRAELTIRA